MDTFPSTTARPAAKRAALVCVQCGYALAGLARSGRCPECSTPIRRSLAALATFPSIQRVPRAMRAGKLLLASFACAGAALPVAYFVLDTAGGPISALVLLLCLLGWWAGWHGGWILLATSDPTIPPRRPMSRFNLALLITSILSAVAPFVSFAFASLGFAGVQLAASNAQPPSLLNSLLLNLSLGAVPLFMLAQVALAAPLLERIGLSMMLDDRTPKRPRDLWLLRVAIIDALLVAALLALVIESGYGPMALYILFPLLAALGVTSLALAAVLLGAVATAMTAMTAAREEPLDDARPAKAPSPGDPS